MAFAVVRSYKNTSIPFFCSPRCGGGLAPYEAPAHPAWPLFAGDSHILFPPQWDFRDVLQLRELSVRSFLCWIPLCSLPMCLCPLFAPVWRLEEPFSHTGCSGLVYTSLSLAVTTAEDVVGKLPHPPCSSTELSPDLLVNTCEFFLPVFPGLVMSF